MDNLEFKQLLSDEKKLYLGDNPKAAKQMKKTCHKRYYIWKYLYYFRLSQFYIATRTDNNTGRLKKKIAKYKYRYYNKKRNKYSYKSGVEIGIGCNIGKNCDIWHSGVVVNADVGDNCIFHGNNILGNKGKGKESLNPKLGNNVDVGAGATIIGDVSIADDSVIGAGAVVTKSFINAGNILVGVPANAIRSKNG